MESTSNWARFGEWCPKWRSPEVLPEDPNEQTLLALAITLPHYVTRLIPADTFRARDHAHQGYRDLSARWVRLALN